MAAETLGCWFVAGKAPYTSCLRGRVFAPQGFLKLVFEKGTGVIIGVHILGTDACELIHCEISLLLLHLLAVPCILPPASAGTNSCVCLRRFAARHARRLSLLSQRLQSLPDHGFHRLVVCPASC